MNSLLLQLSDQLQISNNSLYEALDIEKSIEIVIKIESILLILRSISLSSCLLLNYLWKHKLSNKKEKPNKTNKQLSDNINFNRFTGNKVNQNLNEINQQHFETYCKYLHILTNKGYTNKIGKKVLI